jgi:Domain of unknown function (DUF6458)
LRRFSVVPNPGSPKAVPIGTSILLIAVGAILRYAVTTSVSGIKIQTVGLILMIVGVIGLVISLLYTAFWADRTRPARDDYIDPTAPRGRPY